MGIGIDGDLRFNSVADVGDDVVAAAAARAATSLSTCSKTDYAQPRDGHAHG